MRLWIALLLAALSAPAEAADWWWVGINGSTPNRVLTYFDRETIHPGNDGAVEVWALAIGETALPNGQQLQATHYGFKCGQRSLSTMGRVAYDSAGKKLPLLDVPPSKYGAVTRGSIGESILRVVCGRPAGTEIHVDQPIQHALAYFRGQAAPAAATAGGAGQHQDEESGLSLGTGFFVGPAGFVLTSYHVVAGAQRIGCRTADGAVHDASIARMSQANDLALLKTDVRPVHYLGFAPAGSLRTGDRVFTIGYGAPNYLGVNEPRFTEGTVSALSGPGAEDAYMQISVPVQPGNSGGPLLNEAGQLVGIIAAQAATEAFVQAEGTLPQSINWAVKADYAAPLLSPQPPAPRRTREQAIALARSSLCLIVADRRAE